MIYHFLSSSLRFSSSEVKLQTYPKGLLHICEGYCRIWTATCTTVILNVFCFNEAVICSNVIRSLGCLQFVLADIPERRGNRHSSESQSSRNHRGPGELYLIVGQRSTCQGALQVFEGASLSGSSQRSSRVSFSQPPARAQERGRPRGGFFRASRSSVLGLPPFLCARPSSVKVQLHLQRTLDSQSVSL